MSISDVGLELLLSCRRSGPSGHQRGLAGLEEVGIQRPMDCSLTFSLRAASATDISPASTLLTIREEFLDWIYWWYLATIDLTDRIAGRQVGTP